MRKILSFLFILLILGCEKVIDLDLEFSKTSYVIDGKINKHVNSVGGFCEVNISKSRAYFSDNIDYVNDAIVKIIEKENNKEYILDFIKNGQYKTSIPNISETSEYELIVLHEYNEFSSFEKLTKSSLIDSVIQGERNSLSGDEVEIITTFTDLNQIDNYFLFEFGDKGNLQPARDLYINGNSFSFSYFMEKTEIPETNKLRVKMEGIDYNYFKYMLQIVVQTNTQNGPFSTPPAPIKGNIINVYDNNSTVFGYFKVCEFDEFILEDIIID